MKIAMIGLRGLPASYSGVEVAVQSIGSRLVREGHDVTVYCMGPPPSGAAHTFKGMKLIYIPTLKGKNTEMPVYSMLASIHALFSGYDIVHIHALGPAVMTLLFWIFGNRVVVTCHGLDYNRGKWGSLAKAYIRLGETLAMRFAGDVICVSKSLSHLLEQRYKKMVSYIPNGAVLEGETENIVREPGFGLVANNYVIFVGRLVDCKKVDDLIVAYRGINTDKNLVIVGGGDDDYVSSLRELAGDDTRIMLLGPLYGDVLVPLFRNAGLFVLPSILEGLPVALIEAMSFGVPVLVSDLPENLEVIEDEAGIYRGSVSIRGDVSSLREELERALERLGELRGEGAQNAALVRRKYSWDAIASQTLACYANVIAKAQQR